MINKEKFESIKKKHGRYASWAIWSKEDKNPTSNIGNLEIFNIKNNKELLEQLNPNIILVGLNFSRKDLGKELKDWNNFHSSWGYAKDYKIRYGLKDTSLWGGYMTDIIKKYPEKESKRVMSYLKSNKIDEKENIKLFRQELKDLGSDNPIIIAFGNDVYNILDRNFKDKYKILRIRHYSFRCSKEEYKKQVLKTINDSNWF